MRGIQATGSSVPKQGPIVKGTAIHQQVVAEYLQNGRTDLGLTHPTTDVSIGGPGTQQVSIVTVDLEGKTVSRNVPAGRTHPLTSRITSKAWKSSVDPRLSDPRILHVETYGPKPTPQQVTAIEAARREAMTWEDSVNILWRHRK